VGPPTPLDKRIISEQKVSFGPAHDMTAPTILEVSAITSKAEK
jgi:hypothetical protein